MGSALALAGVVLMFGGSHFPGDLSGDLLALAMTVLMALMIIATRRSHGASSLPTAALSSLASSIIAAPLPHPGAPSALQFAELALFGITQLGLGLLLLTAGTQHSHHHWRARRDRGGHHQHARERFTTAGHASGNTHQCTSHARRSRTNGTRTPGPRGLAAVRRRRDRGLGIAQLGGRSLRFRAHGLYSCRLGRCLAAVSISAVRVRVGGERPASPWSRQSSGGASGWRCRDRKDRRWERSS